MKERQGRRSSALIAVLLTVAMSIGMILAVPMESVYAAGSIVQSGDVDTFAKDLPSATAVVNSSLVKSQLTNDTYIFSSDSDNVECARSPLNASHLEIRYYADNKAPIVAGEYDVPSYTITYPGVVELFDGTMADLEVTYNPTTVHITGFGEMEYIQMKRDNAVPVAWFFTMAGGSTNSAYTENDTRIATLLPSVESTADVRIVKDGSVVDATLLMSTVDIDVRGIDADILGENTNKPSSYRQWSTQGGVYDETLEITSGSDEDTYYPNGSKLIEDNGLLRPTASDDNTYLSGYATLVNSTHSFRWTGTDCGTQVLYNDAKIAHTVRAETFGEHKDGGAIEIKTTQGKDVSVSTDNENRTNKALLEVPNHNDVTCTITVKDGYMLDTVLVDGQEITPVDNGDGTYTYTFSDVTADHKIEASFKKPTVTYTTDGNGTVETDREEADFKGNPKGTKQTPNDGYEFKHYTADKDVTLNNGKVIPAGDPISEEEVTEIVVTDDIELMAHYEEAETPSVDDEDDASDNEDVDSSDDDDANEDEDVDSETDNSPDTGDDSNPLFYLTLLIVAIAGMCGLVVKRKRN